MIPKLLSTRRMRPTPLPRCRLYRGKSYRGGAQVSATRTEFSWETAAERWRTVVAELGIWRFTVAVRDLGPGPRHA